MKTQIGFGGVVLAFFLALICYMLFVDRVPPGNVGVRVSSWGTSKGSIEVLGMGRYWNGPGYDLYLFPTFSQNVSWTRERKEEFSFQTVEGLVVGAEIGMTYHVDPSKVSVVFQSYRRGVDEITDTFVRNLVRNALVDEGSTLPVESVYGAGKVKLLANVERTVRAQVAPKGIVVERISWISDLSLPGAVTNAINAKIQATQQAQQRQNQVASAEASARIAIANARGEADSRLINAKAEAEAIQIRGDALRNNQELVNLTIAEKWNGKLPDQLITGGGQSGGPILQLLAPQK